MLTSRCRCFTTIAIQPLATASSSSVRSPTEFSCNLSPRVLLLIYYPLYDLFVHVLKGVKHFSIVRPPPPANWNWRRVPNSSRNMHISAIEKRHLAEGVGYELATDGTRHKHGRPISRFWAFDSMPCTVCLKA